MSRCLGGGVDAVTLWPYSSYTDGLYTKGTRAHTHRELICEWPWEPKGSSLEYI